MLCKQLILITGATATGKTEISLDIAGILPKVEILSVDSRQIYRYMDIGTAKPTLDQRALCPHHFIDILDPDQIYNAGEYSKAARPLIEEIWAREGIPVLVGGTGLYWQSVLDGFFTDHTDYQQVRVELEHRLQREGLESLYAELGRLDPITHGRIDPSDRQRILRGLEVAIGGAKPLSELKNVKEESAFECKAQMVCLTMDRSKLHKRIAQRVDAMIADGLVDEVQALIKKGYGRDSAALGTLGYLELLDCLEGQSTQEEAVELIKLRTRQFAKRQMTWYRRDRRLRELNLETWGRAGVVQRIIAAWEHARKG